MQQHFQFPEVRGFGYLGEFCFLSFQIQKRFTGAGTIDRILKPLGGWVNVYLKLVSSFC